MKKRFGIKIFFFFLNKNKNLNLQELKKLINITGGIERKI
jgi:hypothetical protein